MVGDNISVTHYCEPEDKGKIIGTIKLADIERMRVEAKQEGIKEIVDWIKEYPLAGKPDASGYLILDFLLEAKKKEWGI